jgi:hypothetical protein
MHALPDSEIDLDSSEARFEAADRNERRVDEEATWFCSDAMADAAGNLDFRSTAGTRSVNGPTLSQPRTRPIAPQISRLALVSQ